MADILTGTINVLTNKNYDGNGTPLYKILYPKTSYEQIVGLQDYIEQIAGPMIATATPYASATDHGLVKIGNNLSVSSGAVSLTKQNVINALGFTPANKGFTPASEDKDEIPVATKARRDINGNVITSTYMPIPAYKEVSIPTGWSEVTATANANGDYKYQYKLNITGLKHNDIVNVVVKQGSSQRIASQAFMSSTNESYDGYIYLFAKNQPTAAITIAYNVLKGAV